MTTDAPIRILMVDDDEDAYVITKSFLDEIPDRRYDLQYVYRYEDALIRILRDEHDVYLVDFLLGAKTGLDLIAEVRARGCTKPIICVTMMENHLIDISIMKAGASDYLIKTEMTASSLERSIRYAMMHQNDLNEVRTASDELRRLNKQLQVSEKELTELNRMKDKFFSIISHDLRTPFTTLLGFSEVLAISVDDLSSEQVRDSANRIFQAGKNIHRLLENLLYWSRLQTGRMPCIQVEIDLRAFIQQVFAVLEPVAEQKGIALQNTICDQEKAFADATMLQTIIENLVSNAIKFTPSGGAVVLASRSDESGIYLTVSDTGVGIEEHVIQKLFRIDSQHSSRGTNDEEGTGLGLVICRELVERNYGSITVRSVLGEGTVFTVYLPGAETLRAMRAELNSQHVARKQADGNGIPSSRQAEKGTEV